MSIPFDIPSSLGRTQLSVFIGSTVNEKTYSYTVPESASMLYIVAIGAGAGGGGGFTRAAGNAGGGGGGGAGGNIATLLINARFLPRVIYAMPARGGAGGAAGTTGTAANPSSVYISSLNLPSSTATNTLLITSAASSAGAGVGGSAASGGAGGVAAALGTTITACPLAGAGIFNFILGQDGTSGGAQTGANGTNNGIPTSGARSMGGTGGGGTTSADFSGGDNTIISGSYLGQFVPIASGAGSKDGSGGATYWKPFFSFAGLGGGSSNTGVGGNGGNGGFGAGGGGGGAGTTGGRGGDGGAGVVMIFAR